MKNSIFIFRRDLRPEDNTGLIAALNSSEKVLACFIFTPEEIEDNDYGSDNSVQFMIESLRDLEKQLEEKGGRLYLFYGTTEEIVEKLLKGTDIGAVYVNRDYTPYSMERDRSIEKVCKDNNAEFRSFSDCLLNEPEAVLKKDGKPYTVYTHFYKRSILEEARKPQKNKYRNYYTEKITFEKDSGIYEKVLRMDNETIAVRGGRNNAQKILKDVEEYMSYDTQRDYPAMDATTHLSAHLKFGTCSVREAHNAITEKLGPTHPLIRQLYWRDFFTHIGYHFPKVFGRSFHERFDRIEWSYDKEKFRKWCEGMTGFPIVDAGMRELNATGYMHNRVRMIVASFLVKDLHIDWRSGEKYFAQKLVDYDPCVNNGNWQWAASTGCDAQPYFRIFNPWLQQKKYDPECTYIKRWVPELADIPTKSIHSFHEKPVAIMDYPPPIVDHGIERRTAKAAFSSAGRVQS